jgi:hypothetical protein
MFPRVRDSRVRFNTQFDAFIRFPITADFQSILTLGMHVKPNPVTLDDKGTDNEAIESVLPFKQNVQNLEERSNIHCEKDSALIEKRITKLCSALKSTADA